MGGGVEPLRLSSHRVKMGINARFFRGNPALHQKLLCGGTTATRGSGNPDTTR